MNFKRNSIFMMIIFCGINIFAQTFNPSDIDFTISLEKDTYFVDEPLYLEIKETNITNNEIYISDNHDERALKLELLSESGEKINWSIGTTGEYTSFWKMSYSILQPGESQYYSKDLLEGFGDLVDYKGYFDKTLPIGTYSIKVTHEVMESWKEDFYENGPDKVYPITSNTLTFTIVKAEGKDEEERQAYCAAIKQFYRKKNSQGINVYLKQNLDSQNYYKYDILSIPVRYSFKKNYNRKKEQYPERYQFDLSLEQMINEVENSNASYKVARSLLLYFDDSNKNQKDNDNEQFNSIKEKFTNSKSDSKLSKYYKMELKKKKNIR